MKKLGNNNIFCGKMGKWVYKLIRSPKLSFFTRSIFYTKNKKYAIVGQIRGLLGLFWSGCSDAYQTRKIREK